MHKRQRPSGPSDKATCARWVVGYWVSVLKAVRKHNLNRDLAPGGACCLLPVLCRLPAVALCSCTPGPTCASAAGASQAGYTAPGPG